MTGFHVFKIHVMKFPVPQRNYMLIKNGSSHQLSPLSMNYGRVTHSVTSQGQRPRSIGPGPLLPWLCLHSGMFSLPASTLDSFS